MRKTSQDGGDSTSITSGVDNEMKKPMIGLIKTKKTSFKRKVQNLSHESDDAVIEPLLQKDKAKTEMSNQSAKHLLSKAKTEYLSEVINDKHKLLPDKKNEKSLINAPSAVTGASTFINGTKENHFAKSHEDSSITLHNHMNTNIFSSLDGGKSIVLPKTQILVEIDSGKQSSYNPSPLIFTTAKIHTDGKTKHMEPVQVTPVPILSTIEGSVIKSGNIGNNNKILSGASNKGDVLNTIYAKPSTIDSKVVNEQQCAKIISEYSNLPYFGMPSRLPNENKEQNALSQQSVNSNKVNDVSKSVITVDVNITLPTTTIKSEMGVTGNSLTKIDKSDIDKNDRASKSAIIKDTFMSNGNRIDLNKNIQPLSTSIIDKFSSDKIAIGNKTATDVSGNKQLQRQKQAIAEDNDKDIADLYAHSDKLHKDTIDTSQQKLQQVPDASKSVIDVNKPLSKLSTNLTATTMVASKSVTTTSSADKTSPSTTATLAYTTKTITIPSVSASSSDKSKEETVNPTTTVTSTTARTSLVNKPISTIVPSSAKTTIPASSSLGKPISMKTVTPKPQTVAVSTSIPKKVSEKNVSNPLSTTSVTLKSPATAAKSTVMLTDSTEMAVPKTSLISTAKPIVSTKTIVTSTTKPVGMITTDPSARKSESNKVKPCVSSSESTVKSTVPKTMTNTLSSTVKPMTTVKSPFTTLNNKTSKTPITSADKPGTVPTLSMSYPTSTPPVTKSVNTTTPPVTKSANITPSITELAMKPEKSKSMNAAQSTAKPVTDVASSTFNPVITSSSIPITKKQENSNQNTSLKSPKNQVLKPITTSSMHSTSVISSKSPVTSTSATVTLSNSAKQPLGKS